MLLKPHIPATVVNLAIAILLTTVLLYGFVSIPPDLDQTDTMFWVYAKGKIIHGLSFLSGYVGFGHPATVYRNLKTNFDDPVSVNYTKHRGMSVTDQSISNVGVRVYEPPNRIRKSPCILFFHGGLWISGSVENHDPIASHLAQVLGVVVISVDYRLAPENPYPDPLNDCFTVTEYVLSNPRDLGIDPNKTALFGIGAGGNLAAAVALRLRDTRKHLAMPEIQVLVNPLLQALDFQTPSYYQNQRDAALPKFQVVNAWLWYARGWDGHKKYSGSAMANYHASVDCKKSKMASFVDHNLLHRKYLHESYLPSRVDFGDDQVWSELKDVLGNPYFSPLMAPDLKRMPVSYIVASQYDVVRDDAVMFARRLEKAGNKVTLVHYEKATHETLMMHDQLKLGKKMLNDIDQFLLHNF